jgi:L,D-peptidoglycan transpeptidase YkuD (ErfK/YbiS/YcfS/YnhG family)
MSVAAIAASIVLASTAPPCTASSARQLVSVEAASKGTTYATVTLWSRARASDCWRLSAGPWPARVGHAGLSAHHHEGDGTTPTGTFGFGPIVYGLSSDPGTRFRFHVLRCGDWWDGDPRSPTYNRFRHIHCGDTPRFGGDSEALWTQTTAYRYFAVIEYNSSPVVPGRGSAIFLHAATGAPTNGCVSLRLDRLVQTLRWLDPRLHPRIRISG